MSLFSSTCSFFHLFQSCSHHILLAFSLVCVASLGSQCADQANTSPLLGLELEEEGASNICVSASSVSCPVPTVCGVQRARVAMAEVSPPFLIPTLFPKPSKKTLERLKETLSPNSKFLKFTMIGFAIPCGRGLFPLEETQWLTLAT